jgi:hypothetical protein
MVLREFIEGAVIAESSANRFIIRAHLPHSSAHFGNSRSPLTINGAALDVQINFLLLAV